MNQNPLGIIIAALLAVLIIISGLLFNLTNLTLNYYLTINLFPILDSFLSLYFIGFLITGSLALTTIILIISKLEKQKALIFSLVGYFVGVAIILVFFIQIEFIFALIISGLGIALSIKLYDKPTNGFSKTFKEGTSIAGKIVLLFGIGIFFTILLITLPNASEYEQNFSKDILDSFVSNDTLNLNSQLLGAIGNLQKETISSVQTTPEYKKLQSKNDSDFLDFEMKLEELKLFYTSEEYRAAISEETNDLVSSEENFPKISSELPIIKDVAKFAWLIYAVLAFVSVVFIGEIILKNISALIFAIISKAIAPTSNDLTK